MNTTNESDRNILKLVTIIGGVLFSVMLLVFILGISAKPGGMFYGFKINVLEKGIEYTKFSTEAKLNYHLKLLDRRIKETTALVEDGEVNEGDVQYLLNISKDRSQEMISLLAAEEGNSIRREDTLLYTNQLVNRLLVQEMALEDDNTLESLAVDAEEYRREVEGFMAAKASQFTLRGTDEEVKNFLGSLLLDLNDQISENNLSTGTYKRVKRFIDKAEDYLYEADGTNAILTIFEAQSEIILENYLGSEEGSGQTGLELEADKSVKVDTSEVKVESSTSSDMDNSSDTEALPTI